MDFKDARRLRYSSDEPVTLNTNSAHIFAMQQSLIHMPSGAIYSLIPKNACSTLRFSLAVANGCVDANDKNAVSWIHANNPTFKASLREVVTSPYNFTILRCPFQRLASVYLDKIVGGYADGWSVFKPARTGDDNPQKLSFHQFVKKVTRPNTLRANVHWRPQADCLVYQTYDDVFALKDFKRAQQVLNEKIGLTIIDTRDMLKHDRSAMDIQTGNYSMMPALDIAIMRREGHVPSIDGLYTVELIDLVQKHYAEDIKLYINLTGQDPTYHASSNDSAEYEF